MRKIRKMDFLNWKVYLMDLKIKTITSDCDCKDTGRVIEKLDTENEVKSMCNCPNCDGCKCGDEIDPIGKHICIAMDGMSLQAAYELAKKLKGEIACIKVNDLVVEEGLSAIVMHLGNFAPYIWGDVKADDTTGTMKNIVGKTIKSGASILTVHLSNGREALTAAVEAAKGKLVLSGITILSTDTEMDVQLRYDDSINCMVDFYLEYGKDLGFKSIVCSGPQVLRLLKEGLLDDIVPIIPGMRSAISSQEEKKELNPQAQSEVIENVICALVEAEKDFMIVIGSEVYKSNDPCQKLLDIKASIAQALESKELTMPDEMPFSVTI